MVFKFSNLNETKEKLEYQLDQNKKKIMENEDQTNELNDIIKKLQEYKSKVEGFS